MLSGSGDTGSSTAVESPGVHWPGRRTTLANCRQIEKQIASLEQRVAQMTEAKLLQALSLVRYPFSKFVQGDSTRMRVLLEQTTCLEEGLVYYCELNR